MDFSIYLSFILISLLASLTVYFQKDSVRYLRLFPVFLLITLIVEYTSYALRLHGKTSNTLHTLFTSFEFLFYTYVIREIIHNRRTGRIILGVTGVYVFAVIINFFFIQKTGSFNSMTYALGCLLIAAVSILYFYELFQLTHSVNLMRQPAFWICSGLLFFYCCSFPIYGLLNYLKKAPHVWQKNLSVVVLLLNVFLYSSFTIAFLCRLRTRKSTS